MTIYGERLARVEVEVQELKREFVEHKAETKKELSDMNGKLDDLLTLRNKGAGIFWLASGLVGTGIVGAFFQFFHYFFPTK